MKTYVIAVLLTLAGANSLLESAESQQRLNPADEVEVAIAAIRQKITAAGYDPYFFDSAKFEYELPLPGIFSVRGKVENVKSIGLSNIVISELNYSNVTNKFTYNIAIPEIEASIGEVQSEIDIFGYWNVPLLFDGTVSVVVDLCIKGEAYVHLGEPRAMVSDLLVSASLGQIKSDVHVNIFGTDLSVYTNVFLSSTLPSIISSNEDQINQVIGEAIMNYLNKIL